MTENRVRLVVGIVAFLGGGMAAFVLAARAASVPDLFGPCFIAVLGLMLVIRSARRSSGGAAQ